MPLRFRDWLVFHPPKTGGGTVQAALMNAGAEQVGGGHDLLVHHRHEALERHIGGTIRDPWRQYASRYLHAVRVDQCHRLWRWLGKDPPTEAPHRTPPPFRDCLWAWTHPVQAFGIPREVGVIWSPGRAEDLREAGCGLYTWEIRRMYGDSWAALLATDRLEEGLRELWDVEMTAHKDHNSGRPDYRDWYDAEMMRWIEDSEGDLLAEFGFRPWERSRVAVFRASFTGS